MPVAGPTKPDPTVALASMSPELTRSDNLSSLEAQAARDPIAFFERLIDQYDRSVRDYTCTFTKQELIGTKLTAEQVTKVQFRENPFSVRMEWVKNADKAARVLYVADRWVEKGEQMAVVVPAGRLASLLVSHVMRPIHGTEAKKSSRRTIDQFGARNNLVLALKYAKLATEQGVGDFAYVGNSEVGGRQTLVFERRLPYTGEDGTWPDRRLVVHIDKEWMLPTLCLCYADDEKQTLLGKYMTTDIDLNCNLPESVFTKQDMGL